MSRAPDSEGDDAWIAAIVAAALKRGAMVHRLSLSVAAATLLVFLIGGGFTIKPTASFAAATLVLLCGVIEFWLALRVAFDADLFDALARNCDLAGFDRGMTTLGLAATRNEGRPMAARAQRALRLLKLQGIACAAQFVIALSGGLASAVRFT